MKGMKTFLHKLLASIWLLVFGINCSDAGIASTFGYTREIQGQIEYDAPHMGIFGYDGAVMHTANECVGQLANERPVFAPFSNSFAAEGTATQLEFDFAKGLGSAPKPVYPPNNGVLGSSGSATLVPGTTIDRFGSDFGRFVSPEGTPFIQRSLPSSSASAPYSVFQVAKPFEVQAGQVAPWFGMPGGGVQ